MFRCDRKMEGQGQRSWIKEKYQEQTRRVQETLTGYWSVLVKEQSGQQGLLDRRVYLRCDGAVGGHRTTEVKGRF